MLKLSSRTDEPFWLDIVPGVRVQFRPITVAAMIAARRAASRAVVSAKDDEGGASDETQALANIAIVRALAQQGIVAWQGVGDADGAEIPPSPEAIDQLLDVWPAFDSIDAQYAFPALSRDAEKNG